MKISRKEFFLLSFTKKHSSKILKFNELLFPFLTSISFFLAVVESFTYEGFVNKFLILSVNQFIALYLLSLSLIYLKYHKKIKKKLLPVSNLVLELNKILFIPILMFYYILTGLEIRHYSNYVFSTFHIIPGNTKKLVFLSTALLILYIALFVYKKPIKYFHQKINVLFLVKTAFFSLLFMFVFFGLLDTTQQIAEGLSITTKLLNIPFEQRKEDLSGGGAVSWGFKFSNFIKNNSEENSVIFIPPPIDSWQLTGNRHYMLGLLYPRVLIQDKENLFADIPQNANYVFISYGEWNGIDKGWPKIHISKNKIEKIILIDRYTSEIQVITDADYNVDSRQEIWGLIKLKD